MNLLPNSASVEPTLAGRRRCEVTGMAENTSRVLVYREGDVLHARLMGPVDRETTAFFQQRLEGVTRDECSTLALDLGAAEYLDSDGVRWLQRLHNGLRDRRIELRLLFPEGSRLERVLNLLGLAEAFTIDHYPADATGSDRQVPIQG